MHSLAHLQGNSITFDRVNDAPALWRRTDNHTALQLSNWRRRPDIEIYSDDIAATISSHVRTPNMARLEAALLVAETALSPTRLAQFAILPDAKEARQLVEELNACYDATGSSFRVERVATGYRLLTRPVFAQWLNRLHHRQAQLKLSPPAMETLTIVAYRQPITRADVEAIRGVQCTEMLKLLMERGLVKIGGEDDSLGRPYLYVTTRQFLELFGLKNLADLPMAEELRRLTQQKPAKSMGNPEESETEDIEPEEERLETDTDDEAA